MTITELNGGLGNQMFQYAKGRAVALAQNTSLYLDISPLQKAVTTNDFTARPFGLTIFNPDAAIASDELRACFFPQKLIRKIWYRLVKRYRIYTEAHFNFDEASVRPGRNIFLRGYWQTEKYFTGCEDQLRKDFTFISGKNKLTELAAERIKNCEAVSIHVRRGDYISSASANSFHGLPGLDYYEKAMQAIEQTAAAPFYFVFSDDPAWVKENLLQGHSNMEVIEHNNGDDSWQDMYLMSLCKHNIIANSSFSWWGAWLNSDSQKWLLVRTDGSQMMP